MLMNVGMMFRMIQTVTTLAMSLVMPCIPRLQSALVLVSGNFIASVGGSAQYTAFCHCLPA